MEPKSIKELEKILNEKKGIKISSATQSKKLKYMGYFHGYKGYRYCNKPNNILKYSSFNELQAVYDFDMSLKSMMYSKIMFIETALKNYTLEEILMHAKSEKFIDIFNEALNDYKSYSIGSVEYKQAMKHRLEVRNKIYSVISRDYGKNNIIHHYYDKDEPVPIWAIFELISLGDFGHFFGSLNIDIKKRISRALGIKSSDDGDGNLLKKVIFTLKDLRNSIAHNNIIFDTRFKTGAVNKHISRFIKNEVGINEIDFNSILDYIILIVVIMKLLKCTKTEIVTFIKEFEEICEKLKKSVPMNIYSQIVYTDSRGKLDNLKNILTSSKK